jgi:hypothetical protein
MMARMETRQRPAAVIAVAALVLAPVLAASGCGWRLETPDPSPLVPDETELARDAAAQAEARLVEALDYAEAETPGSAWLLGYEEAAAGPHLEALGGAYDPYPDPTPDPSPSPDPRLGPTSFSRYAAFARDAAIEGALTVEDPDLALLLASIGLSHAAALRLQSEEDSRAAGFDADQIVDRVPPLPSKALEATLSASASVAANPVDVTTVNVASVTSTDLVPAETSISEETLLEIIVLHDYAMYLCEVVAARAVGDLRWIAYLRSRIHQDRMDALVALTSSDPRGPSYITEREEVGANEDMEALLAEVEGDLAVLYIRAFGEVVALESEAVDVAPGQVHTDYATRTWLLAAAFDALMASWLRMPGPESAPVFPGVSVPGYTPVEPSPLPVPSPSLASPSDT